MERKTKRNNPFKSWPIKRHQVANPAPLLWKHIDLYDPLSKLRPICLKKKPWFPCLAVDHFDCQPASPCPAVNVLFFVEYASLEIYLWSFTWTYQEPVKTDKEKCRSFPLLLFLSLPFSCNLHIPLTLRPECIILYCIRPYGTTEKPS